MRQRKVNEQVSYLKLIPERDAQNLVTNDKKNTVREESVIVHVMNL